MTAFRRESLFIFRQRNRLGPGERWQNYVNALMEQPNSERSMLPETRIGDQVAYTLAGRDVEHQDSLPQINFLCASRPFLHIN